MRPYTRNSSQVPAATPVTKPTATLKRTAVREPRVNLQTNAPQVASPKTQVATKKRPGSSGDELVAEDTVVRYGAKRPAPKVQAQMKADGIKRYTDLK